MSEPIRILSLGAGVQSSAVLLMCCDGTLPKVDHAIFADTGWEPKAVYEHLEWLKGVAEKAGIPVHLVSNSNIRDDALDNQLLGGKKEKGKRWGSMPYHTLSQTGKRGMVRRQCTEEYKIKPIEKKVRELAGYKPRQRIPLGTVEQWFGISADEQRRIRISRTRWITNRYPLVFDMEPPMDRAGCLKWMEDRGYPEPARSACIACPFKSNDEWRWLKANSPEEFEEACQFDESMRVAEGMKSEMFIHPKLKPLRDVDIRTDLDKGQLMFPGWREECAGMCGV